LANRIRLAAVWQGVLYFLISEITPKMSPSHNPQIVYVEKMTRLNRKTPWPNRNQMQP
jgi:hypothetical protein